MAQSQRWLPLESNPDVVNKYAKNIGVPSSWQFVDIFGMEPELLAMVPQPTVAVMLLYPHTEKSSAYEIGTVADVGSLYYTKQTDKIGNACGTVALVHALANNADKITFDDKLHFIEFLKNTKDLSAAEKAEYLEKDLEMGSAHESSCLEGQTQVPSRDEKVNFHFVALVHHAGTLYELDGRKEGPINHGETTEQNLLQDAMVVVRKFMDRDPEELNFTLMALSQVEEG